MKTYEAFSEQLCLTGDEKFDAAKQAWKLIESSKSFLECLKRIPEDPEGALKSTMERPEKRIRNYEKHNVIEPMIKLKESEIRHFLWIKPDQFLIYGHPIILRTTQILATPNRKTLLTQAAGV